MKNNSSIFTTESTPTNNCAPDQLRHCLDLYGPNDTSTFDCDAELAQLADCLAHPDQLLPKEVSTYDYPAIPSLEPIKANRVSPGDRIAKSYRLTKKLLASCSILTDGQYLWLYDPETGAYITPRSTPALISQLLGDADRGLCNMSLIREIGECLLAEPSIFHSPNDFNALANLVNTANGVLNLDSMVLLPHSPDWLFTYAINANFNSECSPDDLTCPTFEKFCSTSLEGDIQKRQLLLEIIGFCLSDVSPAAPKCAFFLKGEPDSGKSVICEWLARLLDAELLSHVPLHELGSRFKRAELFGKKINICSEIKGAALHDISTFKKVTGGDRTDGEFKGEPIFYFTPRCKLLFAGNTLPHTTETDVTRAFANRMTVLLFNQSIPPEDQNPLLLDDLFGERDQIFTLAMYALAELRKRGYQFTMPAESKEYVLSYAERSNSIRMFINDWCILGPGEREHSKELYIAYREYCAENCLDPIKKGRFGEFLDGIPRVTINKFRLHGKNSWGRIGIGLKT